jgi:hypothetical protein
MVCSPRDSNISCIFLSENSSEHLPISSGDPAFEKYPGEPSAELRISVGEFAFAAFLSEGSASDTPEGESSGGERHAPLESVVEKLASFGEAPEVLFCTGV